jgi:hypothetical protein
MLLILRSKRYKNVLMPSDKTTIQGAIETGQASLKILKGIDVQIQVTMIEKY